MWTLLNIPKRAINDYSVNVSLSYPELEMSMFDSFNNIFRPNELK
jgi:hypothetical protein